MNYRMAYLSKDNDSSFYSFRTRTPSDVLRTLDNDRALLAFEACMGSPAFVVNVRIGAEVKFSLKTREVAVAEIRKNQAKVALTKLWAARRSESKSLTLMQIMGLARLVHKLYVEEFQQEPGERAAWIAHKALNRAVQEGRLISAPPIVPGVMPNEAELAVEEFGEDFTDGINALPVLADGDQALENRFGLLCDWVLTQNTLRVDYKTRKRLLQAIAIAGQTGPRRLKENAARVYGKDHHIERYPEFRHGRTITQVFDAWRRESEPAPSTVSTWKGHLRSLQEFLGHEDISKLTKYDVVAWKDKLRLSGLSASTINDGYLACIKRLLNFEVENHRLPENVAQKITVASRGRAGETQLPYETEEVAQLLILARAQIKPALRWLPWLAALSGCRIGEVAQLWGSRVKKVGNIWIMSIRPAEDGGRLKNEWSERETPIHQAIISEGFLEYAEKQRGGPLFYTSSSGDRNKKHASKGVCNRLAAWIRLQDGFDDPRKAPNHALRHWFKTELGSLQVPDSLSDAIVGHGKRSEADRYRHYTIEAKAEVINRVAVPGATG
jgi:integrase